MRSIVEASARVGRHAEALEIDLLHVWFARTAAAYPDRPAVACRGEELRYQALDQASNRLAWHLRELGVRRGDYVAVLLPRSPEAYVALLGILKAGAAYVPIDAECPADRVAYILADCGARALVTASAFADRHGGFPDIVLLDEPAADFATESEVPPPAHETGVTPDDVCYVIYTSGTSGRPKGVEVEHRNACHLVRAERKLFGVDPGDRVYQGFSIAFDASVEEIWLAFASGATLVVGTREMVHASPTLAGLLTEAGVTVLSTIPTLLSLLEGDLPTVRLLILGGEPCPQSLVARWWRPGRRMVNTYGPTETTVIATWSDCDPRRPVTIGRSLSGYTVHLLDEHLRPVRYGEPGEICIGGPGVARGYLGLPELTRQKFVPNPFADEEDQAPRLYRSGDLGRYNDEGEIEFLGRSDAQVKLRGFRIELTEIEEALGEQPDVLACAVALREDVAGLPQLVGYVVPRRGSAVDCASIRNALRRGLPAYMIPTRLVTLETLPTLPSGKVDRRRLPPPPPTCPDSAAIEDVAGRTELERKIARVWSALFAPQSVTICDDFFRDLGGHSLLAARMISELRKDPQLRNVSVLDIYQHPTIETLAAKWQAEQQAVGDAPFTQPEPDADDQRRSRVRYRLCALAQTFGLYFVLGFFSLQWLAPYLTYSGLLEHGATALEAMLAALGVLVALYPVMVLATVAIKWLVIGRYKAGRYSLWGVYFWRWWFVNAIQSVVPIDYMAGTPLLSWYLRAMGARVGANVHFGTFSPAAFDLLSVGDDTCIGTDSCVSGWTVDDGFLSIGPVTIGRGCFVGTRSVVQERATMEDGARLEDLSLLSRATTIPREERWAGSPARGMASESCAGDDTGSSRPTAARRCAFGALHALGLLLFPVMVIAAFFPGLALLNLCDRGDGTLWHLLAAPLVALSFVIVLCLEIALAKWILLGKVAPCRFPTHSGRYWRKWFVDQLLELSLDVLGPLYATIYLVPWYRLLGAKLGRRAEVSTASFISPDLLTMGDEGFIADSVSLGAARVENGEVALDAVRVGDRAFVGNSAVLPAGTDVGADALIGCLSIPPRSNPGAESPGTSWLGSPSLLVPQRERSAAVSVERTFRPTRALWFQRAAIELVRVTLPLTCFVVLTSLLLATYLRIRGSLSTPVLVAVFPLLYTVFGVVAALIVVAAKWLMMGRFRPCEHPLWSPFVWRTELVTALHENLAGLFFVEMLRGTPLLPWYFRLLGAKVGHRVYMDTTDLTEFDLVDVGDDVALDRDCTLQTHLFEDRVMKMSTVRIGARCTVGSMAVVLYDTRMEAGASLDALSLLMKGEVLPAGTRWLGSPARSAR
jgi:non-ribosomal peptide synthetase-like protein